MSELSKRRFRLDYNAPVILTFAVICLIVQILNSLTGYAVNRLVTGVGGRSLANPLTWINCICHVFGHSSWEHLISNMMYILLLGPILEEKYGRLKITLVMLITALITGVITVLLFPNVILCGASGIVFAMILLTSFTSFEQHTVPVTFLLIAVLYLGKELYDAIFTPDSTAQFAHIIGGIIGTIIGFILNKRKPVN